MYYSQSTKRVFISFDYENDRHYRYLLSALKENPGSALTFEDLTPEEIQSSDVGRIKAALTTRIKASSHTLVVIGRHANSNHPDRYSIGTRNWQWWEIEKSKEEANRFIAVKIDRSYESPLPLMAVGAKWAYSFNVDAIMKAIGEA